MYVLIARMPLSINAWNEVFGVGVQHMTCSWHVERAWTKRIREEGLLLKAVKCLRLESNESKFRNLYESASNKKWVSITS